MCGVFSHSQKKHCHECLAQGQASTASDEAPVLVDKCCKKYSEVYLISDAAPGGCW